MKQLSKVLAIALMVACAVAFMPLLNGQAFAASKGPKIKSAKYTVKTQKVTVKWAKNKKAKSYQVKVGSKKAKTVKKSKKSYSVKYAQKAKAQTIKVKVRAKVGKKWTKWSTKKVKIAAKKSPAPTPEVVAITGVAIDNAAPKVGDTLTAKVEPANASNVTYQWQADGQDIANATAATFTVTADQLGKKLTVVVKGDKESTATSEATSAVAAVEGDFNASQSGSKSFTLTFNDAISSAVKVTVKKGSATMTTGTPVVSEDGKTVVVEITANIQDADYTVTFEDGGKTGTKTVKGQAAHLDSIAFTGTNLVVASNTNMYKATAIVKGFNQFGEEVQIDPSQITSSGAYSKAETATNVIEDSSTEALGSDYKTPASRKAAYDNKTGVLTLYSNATNHMFISGQIVNVNVVAGEGANMRVGNANLTVSAAAYADTYEIGDAVSSLSTYKDKPLTATNVKNGKYYFPVIIKDQYEKALSADDLNQMVKDGMLIVTPGSTAADDQQIAYVDYVVGSGANSAIFEDIDDNTVGLMIKKTNAKTYGKAVFNLVSTGGKSTTKDIEIIQDSHIETMTVTADTLRKGEKAALTVEATDANGDAWDMYTNGPTAAVVNSGSGASKISKIEFNDDTTTAGTKTYIQAVGGELTYSKNAKTKTTDFFVQPDDAATTVTLTWLTAGYKSGSLNLTVNGAAVIEGIKAADDIYLAPGETTTIGTYSSAGTAKGLVFEDSEGRVAFADSTLFADGNYYYTLETKTADAIEGAEAGGRLTSATIKAKSLSELAGQDVESNKITVTLYKVKGELETKDTEIASKTFSVYVVPLAKIDSFSLEANNTLYVGAGSNYEAGLTVSGTYNGNSVQVPQTILTDATVALDNIKFVGDDSTGPLLKLNNTAKGVEKATKEVQKAAVTGTIEAGSKTESVTCELSYSNATPVGTTVMDSTYDAATADIATASTEDFIALSIFDQYGYPCTDANVKITGYRKWNDETNSWESKVLTNPIVATILPTGVVKVVSGAAGDSNPENNDRFDLTVSKDGITKTVEVTVGPAGTPGFGLSASFSKEIVNQ